MDSEPAFFTFQPMTDADRIRLLFGPYKAPALRRGDRAVCLVRDCDVVITGWTNAPISWPRCRALGTRGGGSGILVDEVLAWAIRHESALAIKYWWRASRNTVWWWRQSLGVGRADSEGSRRLICEAAKAGGFAMFEREIPDEEYEARRQRSIELNLGRFLSPGNNAPLWTPDEIALLGAMPDQKLAKKIGRTHNAVRLKREELGIPNPYDSRKHRRKRK